MGRRLFDVVDAPQGWSDELGYGAHHAAVPPVVVVTHAAPTDVAARRPVPVRDRRGAATRSTRPGRWRATRTSSSWAAAT